MCARYLDVAAADRYRATALMKTARQDAIAALASTSFPLFVWISANQFDQLVAQSYISSYY